MRSCLYWFSLTLGVLLATHAARADDTFTFTTEPDPGDISGTAGSTVGWGYSITNNSSTDYLILDSVAASVFPADDTPDSTIFDLPIVAPGGIAMESYVYDMSDPESSIGLFQFTWAADPMEGESPITGDFTVTAQFCSDEYGDNCGD